MTTIAPIGKAEAAAEALYAAGELSPQPAEAPPEWPGAGERADVAVTTKPGPHPAAELLPPNAHGLPEPPALGVPGWALTKPPARDAAQAGLYPTEIARADGFWRWLVATRRTCAQRTRKGYVYLAGQRRLDAEDAALYRQLRRRVAWCDGALWLLRAWYAPHDAAPQPLALALPFAGLTDGRGETPRLVRELHGLPDEELLEDVLSWWHQLALATGYLAPLDDGDGNGEEGENDGTA